MNGVMMAPGPVVGSAGLLPFTHTRQISLTMPIVNMCEGAQFPLLVKYVSRYEVKFN